MKKFNELIEPKKFKTSQSGLGFHVGKIPAYYAQMIMMKSGRALSEMDMSLVPKEALDAILSYIAVDPGTGADPIVLDNQAAVDMLCTNVVDLIEMEVVCVKENFGFFFDGSLPKAFKPLEEAMAKAREEKQA